MRGLIGYDQDSNNQPEAMAQVLADHLETAMSYQQQQEQDELMFYLWSSLSALRDHISAETFQRAEHELGFNDRRNLNKDNGHGKRADVSKG